MGHRRDVKSFDPEWGPAGSGSRVALAFKFDGPTDVDDAYARLCAACWAGRYAGHKEPWDAFWGQRYAIVHDPDGNAVDLFSPLATSP